MFSAKPFQIHMITDDILTKPMPTLPHDAVDALNRAIAKRKGISTTLPLPSPQLQHQHQQYQRVSSSSRRISASLPRVSPTASFNHQAQAPPLPRHPSSNLLPRSSSGRRHDSVVVMNSSRDQSRTHSPLPVVVDGAFATDHSDQFHREQRQKHKMHSSFRSLISPHQDHTNSYNVFASPTSEENTQQSIAEETRQFARKQLAEFRAAEERRTESYRLLRSGLRNIETIIQDIPISDQLAKDVREKPPSEQTIHMHIVNNAMHRKITELTELLEMSVKSEDSLRKRLSFAEARVAAAENKIIDLQAKLFEAELKNMQSENGDIKMGRIAATKR